MQIFELKIPPLVLVVVFAVVMWLASIYLAGASFPVPGASVVAFAFAMTGCGVVVAAVSAFRRHGTTVNPMKPETTESIVTAGIYRITRNPMYLGFALVLAAWAMFLANLVALLLVPVFVAYVTRFQIKPEERALLARFGPDFADYMASVHRWI